MSTVRKPRERNRIKICAQCGTTFAAYHHNYQKYCSPRCNSRSHGKERAEYCRKWYQKHPEKNKEYNFRNSLKKFGLTLIEYEALVERQGNVCAICRQPETNGHRLHIDHCHSTGKVRGLLCEKHNLMIGLSGDSSKILLEAAEYLNRKP